MRNIASMARKSESSRPTAGELAILRVLWERGRCTVREVHEHLDAGTGYTTVLKLMQIMAAKGLVTRDDTDKAHVYRPSATQAQTEKRVLKGLLGSLFQGSVARLAMRALSTRKASKEELAELKDLIKELERKEDS